MKTSLPDTLPAVVTELLDLKGSENAFRRNFGRGNGLTSSVLSFGPWAVAGLTGHTDGWVGIAVDAIGIAGVLGWGIRNNLIVIQVSPPSAQKRKPHAINVEFAQYFANAAGREKWPSRSRYFVAGMWNGIKHNGMRDAYNTAVYLCAGAAILASKSFSIGSGVQQPAPTGLGTQYPASIRICIQIHKLASYAIVPITSRDRERAENSILQLLSRRLAEAAPKPPG